MEFPACTAAQAAGSLRNAARESSDPPRVDERICRAFTRYAIGIRSVKVVRTNGAKTRTADRTLQFLKKSAMVIEFGFVSEKSSNAISCSVTVPAFTGELQFKSSATYAVLHMTFPEFRVAGQLTVHLLR
eukprot:scaffold336_cov250-Pinguiococcus_pyrenoidosus.AAC.27